MKQILYLLLILTISFVFAERNIDIPEPADLDLVEEKILLEAIRAAQAAVRNSPEEAEVWGHLGHVYLSHGWEAPAIPCYRHASLLAPEEFRWLYFLGRLTKQRQPKEAVKHLTRALTLNSQYAPAHLYLASALRILGKLDDAQHHLQLAKNFQPNNPFSELWLGEIALARQQVKLARTHLEKALLMNPRQSEAHALMAQVATALGDKQAAKRHAQAARAPSQYSELADPLWWDVLQAGVTASLYAERGRRYMSEGNYTQAVAEFETLISDEQKDIKVWFDYGVLLLYTARHHEALAVLEHLLSLLDKNIEIQEERSTDEIAYLKAQAYNYIGQIYYETGRTDSAIHTAQKAIELLHNSLKKSQASDGTGDLRHVTFLSNVYANLARVYEETEQLEQAITQYQKALELLPTQPSLHQDLAGVYWKQRRYAEAEPHYTAVIADDQTDIKAIYRLGLIFLTQEKYLKAVEQFERVIDLDATRGRAYKALGVAYQKFGDNSKAIRAFEKVLQLEPNNKKVLEMIEQLQEAK